MSSNHTAQPQIITWKSEPDFRGTFSILSTCLSTLFICVWSAVHIQITESENSRMKSKLVWLLVGTLAPEVLVIIAFMELRRGMWLVCEATKHLKIDVQPCNTLWRQFWQRLRSLNKKKIVYINMGSSSNDDVPLPDGSHSGLRHHPWTLTHSLYAGMGGFAFDTSNYAEPFLPGSPTRTTLTVEGIAYLMENAPDLIPDISEAAIWDKSKANGLDKLLLLIQTLWFCMNCLSRIAQGLPLSLLEVSTSAHALCTACTYAMWWRKPINISEPTLVQGDAAVQMCAWLAIHSHSKRVFSLVNVVGFNTLKYSETLLDTKRRDVASKEAQACLHLTVPPHGCFLVVNVNLHDLDLERFENDKISLFSIIALLCLIYGIPHACAWNAAFPTPIEQALWRAAAIIVTSFGACYVTTIYVQWLGVHHDIPNSWLLWFRALVILEAVLYVAASLFLVAESFRSLFYSTPEIFQIPSWSNYFPHLS